MSQFNLQRQLAEAADRRRIEAGLHPTAPAPAAPVEEPPPAPASDLEALIIDLRDPSSVLTYRAAPEPAPAPAADLPTTGAVALPVWQGTAPTATRRRPSPVTVPGSSARPATRTATTAATGSSAPERCPTCEGTLRLDRWDLDEAVAHISCIQCGFRYRTKRPRL